MSIEETGEYIKKGRALIAHDGRPRVIAEQLTELTPGGIQAALGKLAAVIDTMWGATTILGIYSGGQNATEGSENYYAQGMTTSAIQLQQGAEELVEDRGRMTAALAAAHSAVQQALEHWNDYTAAHAAATTHIQTVQDAGRTTVRYAERYLEILGTQH
jgi:hypothetical protein